MAIRIIINVHTHVTRLFMQQLLLVLDLNIDNLGCVTAWMREILFLGEIDKEQFYRQKMLWFRHQMTLFFGPTPWDKVFHFDGSSIFPTAFRFHVLYINNILYGNINVVGRHKYSNWIHLLPSMRRNYISFIIN